LAFSKADQCSFFNVFSGLKIKSNCPDFFNNGSGNELSTVPIIFTRQSKNFITQKISGFLSANHKHKINIARTSKMLETISYQWLEREEHSKETGDVIAEASRAGKRLARIRVSFYYHSG